MKICDLTQAYTPTSGGIRTYIDEKRKFIEKHDSLEHLLIIPADRDSVSREGRLTVYRVASPHIPGCEPYRVVLRLARVISILASEKPDIIELGCAYTLPWAAFRHRHDYNCRVVGFYHTDFPKAYVETAVKAALGESTAKTARMIASQYARLVYTRCDLVIAPSRPLQKNLSRYGVKNVEFLPLGVDTEVFNPSRRDPSLREMLGFGDEDLMLVYSGRLDSEKRVDVLIEAVKRLPEDVPAKLVLVGDGPLRKSIQSSEKHNRRITVVPHISSKTELAALLASGDIYVTAGPFETFGLSVLEAQACGLPVVGVRAGALVERVPSTVGTLGRPGDSEHMARNILEFSRNGFRKMGEDARALVESTYSWEKTFGRLLKLYQDI